MTNPVCAIIGSGEGLGRALARKFASENFDLALVSRTEQGSAVAMAACEPYPVEVGFFPADANQPEYLESAMSDAISTMGDIDVMIYNVRGEFTACEPLDMSYQDLQDVFQTEVVGAFAAAKTVLPNMIDRGKGSIFFSSATAAFRGSKTYPIYSVGKFGLRSLSQSLAKAYAAKGVHIVHVRLDCDLDVPYMRKIYGEQYNPDHLANPDDVAQSYWLTHLQPKSAWSNEIELRPLTENWTC